ncbi:unnamed protein product [Fraxinus pennsylvanica]|uniref:Uncharacterized protein n=1 Tax=Fraxinus pennsylvanica TaxID=56036 RepID=A0AAD2A3E1_9LAMI|nr:unnamed protein product [Fraxinus pennsylvanica]
MRDILHSSPPHLSSTSSSVTRVLPSNINGFHQQAFLNNESLINGRPVAFYRRDNGIQEVEQQGGEEDQFSVLEVLVSVFRKSLVGCRSTEAESGAVERLMEIGWPTNVRHVAHVIFDRFNGFLGLPVEFEPEVPRIPPSASTRVFGVSTESMQLSFDSRGNCMPTILLMMQRRLYRQGGLQAEGIFRINAENGQEEYVREQLNNGEVPDDIDVHCLAGLIKAWFRELPRGVLDPLSPEQVMQAQSEDECTQLARLLPPTEAALLDWTINLMADVAQFEHLNKMNARNIAMVFAPNMTQMSDPLTALMHAVQVMNFLKTLIEKTLREREDYVVDVAPVKQIEPADEDDHHGIGEPITRKAIEVSEDDQVNVTNEPLPNDAEDSSQAEFNSTSNEMPSCLSSVENIFPDGKERMVMTCPINMTNHVDSTKDRVGDGNTYVRIRQSQSKSRRTKMGQSSKNTAKKVIQPTVVPVSENSEKSKEISIVSLLNSQTERVEEWRSYFRMKIHSFDRKFFHSPPSLTPIQLPSPMEIHLWYVIPSEVKSEALLNQYLDILSPCEKENVFQMRGEEPRKRALLARALVRTTIARYQINSQVSPRSLRFRKNVHGKPELEWQFSDHWLSPHLHFNISHTSSLVACGVTVNSQIGIDVEEKHRTIKHNILSFARRYFSKDEVQFLADILDPEVQRQEFVKLWTLKEAYVKALGRGFSGAPFKTFTIRYKGGSFSPLENSSSEEIVVDSFYDPMELTSNWQFLLLELAGSHYAAICMENNGAIEGKRAIPVNLTVWKTIPFLEDECVSGTDAVKKISGLK